MRSEQFLCPQNPAVNDTRTLQIVELNKMGKEDGLHWSREGRVSGVGIVMVSSTGEGQGRAGP